MVECFAVLAQGVRLSQRLGSSSCSNGDGCSVEEQKWKLEQFV